MAMVSLLFVVPTTTETKERTREKKQSLQVAAAIIVGQDECT